MFLSNNPEIRNEPAFTNSEIVMLLASVIHWRACGQITQSESVEARQALLQGKLQQMAEKRCSEKVIVRIGQ